MLAFPPLQHRNADGSPWQQDWSNAASFVDLKGLGGGGRSNARDPFKRLLNQMAISDLDDRHPLGPPLAFRREATPKTVLRLSPLPTSSGSGEEPEPARAESPLQPGDEISRRIAARQSFQTVAQGTPTRSDARQSFQTVDAMTLSGPAPSDAFDHSGSHKAADAAVMAPVTSNAAAGGAAFGLFGREFGRNVERDASTSLARGDVRLHGNTSLATYSSSLGDHAEAGTAAYRGTSPIRNRRLNTYSPSSAFPRGEASQLLGGNRGTSPIRNRSDGSGGSEASLLLPLRTARARATSKRQLKKPLSPRGASPLQSSPLDSPLASLHLWQRRATVSGADTSLESLSNHQRRASTVSFDVSPGAAEASKLIWKLPSSELPLPAALPRPAPKKKRYAGRFYNDEMIDSFSAEEAPLFHFIVICA